MSRTDLKYLTYLNGYVQTEKPEQITWLDIFKTFFDLGKINIKILSYNLKAVIQHSWRLDFGFYFPNHLEAFLILTRMLKNVRDRP